MNKSHRSSQIENSNKNTKEHKELPPPKRGKTYGNLKRKQIMTNAQGPGRPAKGLKQMNLKLEPETHARFTEQCDEMIKSGLIKTRSEFVAQLLEDRPTTNTSKPSKFDHNEGLTKVASVFFNPDLLEVLSRMAKNNGKTVSWYVDKLVLDGRQCAEYANKLDTANARISELEEAMRERAA